jgi:hypothetical protein
LIVPSNITILPLPAKCPELIWRDATEKRWLRRHSEDIPEYL